MSWESMAVMHKNNAGQTFSFRVELETNGVVWQAAVGRETAVGMGEEVQRFSGAGTGPDVFALGRQFAERKAAARTREGVGFVVLPGGRSGTG